MRKITLTLTIAIVSICFAPLKAQVTVGSNDQPNANAVMDLISNGNKGLLLPRVALSATNNPAPLTQHVEGMTVYNTATNTTTAGYEVTPGYYYNDGTKWVRTPQRYTNWFYMPSISFDTSVIGAGSRDLYALYLGQFKTPKISSTGAPSSAPYVPLATDMYYYITDYDTSVFNNISIDANGKMTYNVIGSPSDCSFINILFVLK